MITVNTLKLKGSEIPSNLLNINTPPRELFYRGQPLESWLNTPKVAIVGSRKCTPYGKSITYNLSSELAKNGVVIISGLAYGVDAAAHQAALEADGTTVAVLPTGLDKIYPSTHFNLARRITENGGLLTEYPPGSESFKGNFIARNRLVSGLADVLLITEAAINSGSLHTARFALEQGKVVMAVPGNINSLTSVGCNNLIKSGALPVTEVGDVLFALKIDPKKNTSKKVFRGSPEEELVYGLIKQGVSSQEELAYAGKMDGPTISSTLTMLEIGGYIRPEGAGNWSIA